MLRPLAGGGIRRPWLAQLPATHAFLPAMVGDDLGNELVQIIAAVEVPAQRARRESLSAKIEGVLGIPVALENNIVFHAAIEHAGIQCDLQRDGDLAVVFIHPVAARPGVTFAYAVAEQPSPPPARDDFGRSATHGEVSA